MLAVEAAHVEADFHDALEHLLDLLHQHQRRQVDEHRGPEPGAGIGRARGEVADLLGEGEVERLVELVVRGVGPRPRLGELEAGRHGLEPQVVLLVDHQGQRLVGGDHDAARLDSVPELVADEMAPDLRKAAEPGHQLGQLALTEVPAAGIGDHYLVH